MSVKKTVEITGAQKGMGVATDERRLVAQAKAGSSCAFWQLYEGHRLRVYNTTYRVRQGAEDAAQR